MSKTISTESLDEIKKRFKPQEDVIRPDDSRVIIAEMQMNALAKMADDSNEIFSQVHRDEVFNISRAILFSRSCLPSISNRIQKKYNESMIFSLPILEEFIHENFKHLHKANRARTQEYLEGLKSLQQRNVISDDLNGKRPTLLNRIV